jgi:hypothetical protein
MENEEVKNEDTGVSFISRPYVGEQRSQEKMQEELSKLTGDDKKEEVKSNGEVDPDNKDTPFLKKSDEVRLEPSDDFESRYKNLRAFSDRKITALTDKVSNLQDEVREGAKQVGVSIPGGEMSDDELAAVLEKNPAIFRFVETVAAKRAQLVSDDLNDERKETKRIRRELGEAKIVAKHNNWDELKTDEKFLMWLDALPETMTNPMYDLDNFDPEPAIKLVDFYNTTLTSSGQQEKKNVPLTPTAPGAGLVSTQGEALNPQGDENEGKKVWKESEVKKLKREDHQKNPGLMAEIELAAREGRYIMD